MVTKNASSQEKLVSIICRTVGRPVLTHTLESVLSQTYPHIELILVNAANSDLSIFKNLIESLNTGIILKMKYAIFLCKNCTKDGFENTFFLKIKRKLKNLKAQIKIQKSENS